VVVVVNLRFYQGLGVCEATVERQVAVAQPPVQDGLANRIADQDGRPPPLEQPAHHGQGQLLRACVTLSVAGTDHLDGFGKGAGALGHKAAVASIRNGHLHQSLPLHKHALVAPDQLV